MFIEHVIYGSYCSRLWSYFVNERDLVPALREFVFWWREIKTEDKTKQNKNLPKPNKQNPNDCRL